MSEISLRKIRLSEVESLQKISSLTFMETFSEVNSKEDMRKYLDENLSLEKLKSEIENPESEFYISEIGNRIVGYLKLNFGKAQTENFGENGFEIERIYVLKEHLGQKVGQFLLDKSLEIGKEKSMDFVWLGVWENNERAIKFYKKQGFEVFSQHDFVLGNDVQTDLLMKLELTF